MDEPLAAKRLFELWYAQDRPMRRRAQVWKANRMRRRGVTGVVLVKAQDQDQWIAYAPPGASKQVPALNKAARLCRLLAATIFADPPEAEAQPSSDQDSDRDAAEFATRVLTDLGSERQLNTATTARQALDLGSTYGSGFRYYWVDPRGGGRQPLAMLASPQRVAPVLTAQDAITDPTTGQAYPPPYVTRYRRLDGSLTDKRDDPQVQRTWVPRIKSRLATGMQVRPLPPTARDIWDASGLMLGLWVPLDELRTRFKEKVPQDPETLKKWVAWRPEHAEDIYPGGKRGLAAADDAPLTGESLVFTLTCYYTSTDTYPDGAYVVAVAGDQLLHRQTWQHPKTGAVLDLPLDQFGQMDDEDDFYKTGMMSVLGPGNEIRASVLGGMLEHLDRFNNRKIYVPTTSTYQARSAQAVTGTHIMVNPGGEPKHEQVPDFPKALAETFPLISTEMDHESGLEPPVTGQNPPAVGSGLHARTIIEQVHIGLSDIQQNTVRGLERGWFIQLQLASAFYTVPQRISWVGDDNVYKERLWTGADLGSTKDVKLHRGTLSMLAPSAKAAVAQEMYNVADPNTGEHIISLPELRRIILGNVGGLLGLQDDPARQRIRRQIDLWRQGPPAGALPPTADPATGQLPPDPVWAPVPADDDPRVAAVRYHELTRLLASTDYTRWAAGWQLGAAREWDRMRIAAGVVTVADQQQQAAEQQAAQDQSVQAQEAAVAQEQARGLEQQTVAAQNAAALVNQAVVAVLQQTRQDMSGLLAQQQQLLAAHHAELLAALQQLAAALQPAPPVPPAPMTVSIPAQEAVSQAVAAVGAAVDEMRTATADQASALAQLAAAVERLAARPTSFTITEDARGRPTGIAPNTPGG